MFAVYKKNKICCHTLWVFVCPLKSMRKGPTKTVERVLSHKKKKKKKEEGLKNIQ